MHLDFKTNPSKKLHHGYMILEDSDNNKHRRSNHITVNMNGENDEK